MTANTINTAALFEAWAAAEQAAHQIMRPLQTEADYEVALATLEALWEAKAGKPELGSLLSLLTARIQEYEARTDPMPAVSAAKALAFLMAQQGLSQSQLASETGIDQSNLSRLLSGEREFTTAHIRILAPFFRVNPAIFL